MQTKSTPHPLNQKQIRFLDRYHITGNLGQSWLDAGYNCSIESASSNAGRVLQREDAQEYLTSLQQYDRQHTGLTREKLLARLEEIIDDPGARDRDVLIAIREAGRMIGAYQTKPAKQEPPVDTLHEFIQAVRNRNAELYDRRTPAPPVQATSATHPETGSPAEPQENYPPQPRPSHQPPASTSRPNPERDPDWHPLYNPHYDPTIRKPNKAKVILPCGR